MVVLVMSSLAATAGPAPATVATVVPKTQEQPRSTWVQPGTDPLDGLGTFVYLDAPTAGATQGSVLGYEYTVLVRFEDGSGGIMALGYKNGQKVAGFMLVPSHPVIATAPFDWQFGHIYYLLTYRIGTDVWAAWVYDWSTATWTFIAQESSPGMGRMLPTTTAWVDYDSTLAPRPAADQSTCAYYPRVDAYLYPPTGWRGAVMTQATLGANTVTPGDCPTVTSTSDGWQHYALGATASG
jgi:hypothetical protein